MTSFLNIFRGNKKDGSLYSVVSCSELTPGSLEVWLDLPDSIKYDPVLAPFQQLYEQHHGKPQQPVTNEGDKSIFNKKNLPNVDENSEIRNDAVFKENSGSRLMSTHNNEDDTEIKSAKKKRLDRTLRILKLSALVALWVLLTVSLLLNREKTDVILHTAVSGGEVKEYILNPSLSKVRIQVTLTGPFLEGSKDSQHTLSMWLSRTLEDNGTQVYEQNSTLSTLNLQPAAIIDFSPSVTESATLSLDTFTALGRDGFNHGLDIFLKDSRNFLNATKVSLKMQASADSTVPLTVCYQMDPLEERDGLIYSTLLLITLYTLIIFEIINRTIAALLSSSLAIAVLAWTGQRPSLPELVSWLDAETLLLLLSMMLLVAVMADTGLFDYLAVRAFEITGGRTWPLINCLCLFTAVFSTFLDNVTTVLLMTPVTIRLCEVMQLNPVPVLMSMVIFSNVGGAATAVGDPPNVIIASHPAVVNGNINFTTFTLHMGVGVLLVAVQTHLQLRYMFRDVNKLRHSVPVDLQEMRQEMAVWRRAAQSLSSYSRDEDIVRKALEKKVEKLHVALMKREAGGTSRTDPRFSSTLAQMKEKYCIRDKPLLIKSAICITFVVVVFFLHAIPELQRLSLGWTALLGAILLLLLSEREDLEPILARVEWSTLLFFAALFVMMESLSKLGLISWIGRMTENLILQVGEDSRLAVALMLILWVSGLASAFVDNIPLTTMMVRVTAALAAPDGLALPLAPLSWALSFGACLGGNGTLIGASANVVCAGVAEQHGYRFTFLEYLKVGFPIMIGNLLVASVYLLFCHCVFTWH